MDGQACEFCFFWKPDAKHRRYATCMWPGNEHIPTSVVEIEKVPMHAVGGTRCPAFKRRSHVERIEGHDV